MNMKCAERRCVCGGGPNRSPEGFRVLAILVHPGLQRVPVTSLTWVRRRSESRSGLAEPAASNESCYRFTCDSPFPGGHGKTATREHHDSLMDDLERKVFGRFDDDTWVYPGHGDDTTLGAERPQLPEWRERGW